MNQKIRSALIPLVGLGIVVVSFALESGTEEVTAIDWDSIALWGAILGWGMGWLSKSPTDAHAIDRNGGRR